MALCTYCGKARMLCTSHAVPNGKFRPISRINSGKMIAIQCGEGKNQYTIDTGKTELLCSDCEAHFNHQLEAPLVNALNSSDIMIVQGGFSVRHAFDQHQMVQCLVSVFWRACQSISSRYSRASVSNSDQNLLSEVVQGPLVTDGKLETTPPSSPQNLLLPLLHLPSTNQIKSPSE